VEQVTLPRADLMAQASMPRVLRHLVPMEMTNGQKFSVRTPVLIADVVDLEEAVAMPELEVLVAVVATEASAVIAETSAVTVEVTEASVVIVEVTEASVVKAEASVETVVATEALVAVIAVATEALVVAIAVATEVMAEIVVDSEVDLAVMRSLSTILVLLANLATLEVEAEAGVIEVSAVTEEVTVRAEEASAVTEVVTVVETGVLEAIVAATEASEVIVAVIEEDMAVVTEVVTVGATAEVAVVAAKVMAHLPTLLTPRCLPALALPWRTRSTSQLPPLARLLRN